MREVLADLDFAVYAVDLAGRGGRGFPTARAAGGALPGAPLRYGAPPAGTEAMTAYETRGGELSWVELRSGDWRSLDGPYVTVRTYRPGAERGDTLPELEELVERERDRVYEQIGIDEGDSPGRVRALREWITVDGEPTAAEVHEEHGTGTGAAAQAQTVWAGRLRVHGTVVTLCARGVAPGAVELLPLAGDDFERFLAGRGELLHAVGEQRRRRLAEAQHRHLALTGLDAHRAVLEFSVERALAVRAHRLAQGEPRLPRRLRGEERPEQWEAALRQQMRLAGEDRREAHAALESMVGHLVALATLADWLPGTPDGRAALEELVRYTAFASHVPSLPAQRAWERLRARPAREPAPGTAGAADVAGGDEREWREHAEEVWLAAWEQWRRERVR
ncbi:hypothetical protein GCM10009665_03230 [Kitasatospora nipponensis]|uniref:Uncharacterized protein n=1 Tax=Kitasatospora nipponensis TaxID=258049 RepID=A0ABN1VLX7_9ACTN